MRENSRRRGALKEVLNSEVAKSYALAAPGEAWARHGVEHPLGADFSGMQDFVPQTIDEHTVLSYTAKVPAALLKEQVFSGTPADVIDQVAEWRDHGLRHLVAVNASGMQPSLRKAMATTVPFVKILRSLKKL
jgi:phthiodiolone/phenolphthiodiolone dimycocerosates ketoreductase